MKPQLFKMFNIKLPGIRKDIQLQKSAPTSNGYPTWNIYDPIRDLFFKIGLLEHELLKRWDPRKRLSQLVNEINAETALNISTKEVLLFVSQLKAWQLLETIAPTLEQKKPKGLSKIFTLLPSLFFFRIHIVNPDHFLDRTLKYVRPFLSKKFIIIATILAIISLFMISQRWALFKSTFLYFFNFRGLLFYIIAILITKVIHELGHAYTTKKYGCHVSSMGVVFMFFWPILYTDTTDAWRLNERNQRMAIDAAGMLTELVIATFASIAWLLLPAGPLKSVAYFLCAISWVSTLATNLMPFMRFDGYYLLSDYLEISNLQNKAFALAKWRLREWLFGYGETKPYTFSLKRERMLIVYSYATWCYRLMLFAGIAWAFYNYLFKLVGIILMLTVLVSLLLKPLASEITANWEKRKQMKLNLQTARTLILILALILIAVTPWRSTFYTQAILTSSISRTIYAPTNSVVNTIMVKENTHVKTGQVLLTLTSPELRFEMARVNSDIAMIKWRLAKEVQLAKKLGVKQADIEELVKKENELKGLLAEKARLAIRAPFSGRVTRIKKYLAEGETVAKGSFLLAIVQPKTKIIRSYVTAREYNRIDRQSRAEFFADNNILQKPLWATIINIQPLTINKLEEPYLASIYGGDIAVTKNREGRLIPNQAIYKILLAPNYQVRIDQATRGHLKIYGQTEILIVSIWHYFARLFSREYAL